jgi:polyphosphate kinase 2 (PPK2 family)
MVTVGRHLLAALEERLAAPAPEAAAVPLPPSAPPETNVLSVLDLGVTLDPDAYERSLTKTQGALARLARRLGPKNLSAVLVFEGPDAAGKGGCIRRVVQVLDARFYRVVPIAAPTDEERARPYLWRFWRHLPRKGEWALFDRSWYGRVLVERVEGLCEPAAWQRAYAEINAFEEQLVGSGTLVFKFWLAIDPEEQKRRFTERETTAYKRYKLTPEDWRNREKWSAYETAACDMFERTSSEMAPWTLIEANDKRHARIRVLETLRAGLEQAVGRDEKPRAPKRRKHKA